jgi:hypothetical protein
MVKLFLAILLILSTCAVVAHGVLVYQQSVTEFAMIEEEPSEDTPLLKETKEIHKETVGFSLYLYREAITDESYKTVLNKVFPCLKGFYNKPYNPPDFV